MGAGSQAPVPRSVITWPRRLSIPVTKAPDWTQVTDEELHAEVARRAIEEPLLLWQAGMPPRREVVASTMRGVVVASGGNRSAKTVGAGTVKLAAIAEGLLPMLTCPEWCPQYGEGTCGLHACPCFERGSATIAGCMAGYPVACAKHPPLWFPTGPNGRTLLVGGLSLEKWNTAILPAIERWLSRHPDGTPQWTISKQDHAIIHEQKRYKIQFYPYDDPTRWESSDPCFILWDEIGTFPHFRASVWRTLSQNTQLLICGTPVDLKDNPDRAAWMFPEVLHKMRLPTGRTQVFYLRGVDNVFLEPEARERLRDEIEGLVAAGHVQEAEIRGEGKFHLRQDACFFSQDAIEAQSKFIQEPQRHYITLPEVASQWVGERSPYFLGPTEFPTRCNLPSQARDMLVERRTGTDRGGVACYDCVARCQAYVAPPALSRIHGEVIPQITAARPKLGEFHEFSLWVPPQVGHRYAAGGDNAKGLDGGDYSVLDIVDVENGEQVAQYYGQPRVDTYEWIIFALWRWYRFFLVFEENGFGTEILLTLRDRLGMDAADIFTRLDRTRRLPSGDAVAQLGFWTTRGNKTGTAATLTQYHGDYGAPLPTYHRHLKTQHRILRSQRSWKELGVFIQKDGRLAAMPGSHDDTVISGALTSLAVEVVEQNGDRRPALRSFDPAHPVGTVYEPEDLPPSIVMGAPPQIVQPKSLSATEWEARFKRPARRW